MSGFIDLHMHTAHSDGIASPRELLALVRQKGLAAFAITDHDTINGYAEMRQLLTKDDPELISGVELSTSTGGRDIHLLAYMFDASAHDLLSELEQFQVARRERGQKIVEKLNQLKVPISYDEIVEIAGDGVIGRPHIAEALVKKGKVRSYEEAFSRYIGTGAQAYVPKRLFHPKKAIELVHKAGGVIVMAHPGLEEAYLFLEELIDAGLDGIEVYHPTITPRESKRYQALAAQHNLLMTGGSDYHGRNDHHGEIGSQPVPAAFLTAMKERVTHR